MYYRYKPKRKKKRVLKPLAIILIISAAGYFSYRYREHLMFWKYSDNKLISRLDAAENSAQKLLELESLVPVFDNYRESNPLSPNAYFYSAKVHYNIALACMPGRFSELVINERTGNIPNKAAEEFQKTIKYIRKAAALSNKNQIDHAYLMILAYSCFYTSFLEQGELNALLSSANRDELVKNTEDARFYSLVKILNKEENEGFDFLSQNGRIDSGIDGILFLSCTESMVERYTNAIMNYKKILDASEDGRIKKLVHVNLGKIYYRQSLYNESIEEFSEALKEDAEDISLKIWLGRNYASLGQHDKAKAIWNEALSADKNNSELKKLLGVI